MAGVVIAIGLLFFSTLKEDLKRLNSEKKNDVDKNIIKIVN